MKKAQLCKNRAKSLFFIKIDCNHKKKPTSHEAGFFYSV